MKTQRTDSILTALAIAICAIGIVLKLWTWADFKLSDKGWNSLYYSNSIAESKERNVYICKYEQISRNLSYPNYLYIPPIRAAFAEQSYDRFPNEDKAHGNDPYIFKISTDAQRIVVLFEDSSEKPRSYFKWHIRDFGGGFPEYSTCSQDMEIPDTLTLELYHLNTSIPDSIINVPLGTIKLKRMD